MKMIGYAKDFLSTKNPAAIKYFTLPEFEQLVRKNPDRRNFCWSESLTSEQPLPSYTPTGKENCIDERFTNTLDGLIIFTMNEAIGYGVVTLHPIKQGTIVTHYVGRVLIQETDALTFEDKFSAYKIKYDDTYLIDAKKIGNIASFIQDAPRNKELKEEYIFYTDDVAAQIATANLAFCNGILQGQKVVYMEALRDIQAGEMLLVDYGAEYWETSRLLFDNPRLLFAKDTSIIAVELYEYRGGKVKIKYDVDNFVERPYASFASASKQKQPLRYEVMCKDGRVESRELSIETIQLITNKALSTTVVKPNAIPLKSQLIQRLHKEFQLQAIIYPSANNLYKLFYKSGMEMLRAAVYQQMIACLLQALWLAIKEQASANEIANIYLDLGNAYAGKAQQDHNIEYMAAAIYLIKQSKKIVRRQECMQRLREYRRWQRQHASFKFYCQQLLASVAHYLKTL